MFGYLQYDDDDFVGNRVCGKYPFEGAVECVTFGVISEWFQKYINIVLISQNEYIINC